MPIEVKWLDDLETILCFHVKSPWTVDDVLESVTQTDTLRETHLPEAIVFDVRQAKTIPRSFMIVASELRKYREDVIKIRVVVGPNRIIRLLFDLVNRVFPDLMEGIVITETLQEAYDYIIENKVGEVGKLTADD